MDNPSHNLNRCTGQLMDYLEVEVSSNAKNQKVMGDAPQTAVPFSVSPATYDDDDDDYLISPKHERRKRSTCVEGWEIERRHIVSIV